MKNGRNVLEFTHMAVNCVDTYRAKPLNCCVDRVPILWNVFAPLSTLWQNTPECLILATGKLNQMRLSTTASRHRN